MKTAPRTKPTRKPKPRKKSSTATIEPTDALAFPEIKDIAARPTLAELRDRLHQRTPVSGELETARLVREERKAR